jgi:hypothetical protein
MKTNITAKQHFIVDNDNNIFGEYFLVSFCSRIISGFILASQHQRKVLGLPAHI